MSLMLLEALDAVIKSSLTSVMTGVQGTTCSGTISTIKINKNTYLKDGLEPVEFYHSNVLNGDYPWSNPFVFGNRESAPNLIESWN